MSPDARPRPVTLAAEPLDFESRRLVPRALARTLDEPTAQRDQEVPSTEPDGAGNDSLPRVRDSVISGLRLLEDQKQKTPVDARVPAPVDSILAEDRPTKPARPANEPSDVFAPLGARDRVLDAGGATPRDRPPRHIERNKLTDLEAKRAVTTLTMQGRAHGQSEITEPLVQARYERESNQERAMVESIYNSERAFMILKDRDPQRAADIESLSTYLKATGDLTDRDMVLAAHAREKVALAGTSKELRDGHEDRVIAFALVGRELDDRYREQMRVQKEKLLGEIEALPEKKRDEVFADFESFTEKDAANDSNFCRRQMHKALREEREELHRAYVYALALNKKQARVEENLPTVVSDDDTGARRRRG